jgi:hypothetical protein
MIRATGVKIWSGFVNVKTHTMPGVLSISRCWIAAWFLSGTKDFSVLQVVWTGSAFTQSPIAWVSRALWRWERCWSVKLTAHFRVEVKNDGRCNSSPLMNYVNALDNARKITVAYFCLSHGGILHIQQQLRSNAFEHKLLFNKTIGNIITITSQTHPS